MIVLDASVALAWCFRDEKSAYANQVATHLEADRSVVPSVWPFEVANALLSAQRRGRIDTDGRSRVSELLSTLPIEIEHVSLGQALGPISQVAERQGLTAYDASYLELAQRLDAPLATLDDRLAAAASALGIRLFAAPS